MEREQPKNYHAFELTQKGMELRQRAIAHGLSVNFTRGAVGEGRPKPEEEVHFLTDLVTPVLDVPIKESIAEHVNHIMTIVIDNTKLQQDLLMTEIGIYAKLVDYKTGEEVMEEILYGYTYTETYDYVPVSEVHFIHREISFNTVLSRDGKFEIVFDKSRVYVTREEFDIAMKDFEYKINEELGSLEVVEELSDKIDEHIEDHIIHVTQEEKDRWDLGGEINNIDSDLIEDINNKLDEINDRTVVINDNVSSVDTRTGTINTTVNTINTNVNAINTRTTTMQTTLNTINTNINPATTRVGTVRNVRTVRVQSSLTGTNILVVNLPFTVTPARCIATIEGVWITGGVPLPHVVISISSSTITISNVLAGATSLSNVNGSYSVIEYW